MKKRTPKRLRIRQGDQNAGPPLRSSSTRPVTQSPLENIAQNTDRAYEVTERSEGIRQVYEAMILRTGPDGKLQTMQQIRHPIPPSLAFMEVEPEGRPNLYVGCRVGEEPLPAHRIHHALRDAVASDGVEHGRRDRRLKKPMREAEPNP